MYCFFKTVINKYTGYLKKKKYSLKLLYYANTLK